MSVKVMSLVWEHAPYTAGSLLVFLALADWANDEGDCWPSIARIANKTRLERRSIQYIIRKLEKDGMIQIEEGRGRGHQHRYKLNVQNLRLLPSLIKGAINDEEKAQFNAQKAQSVAEKVQPVSPDPLVEPSEEPSIEPPRGLPFNGSQFRKAWTDYEKYRREMRKPLRSVGRNQLLTRLMGLGEDRATAALIYSMSQNWQGVFEEHNGNGKPTASERNVSNLRQCLDIIRARSGEPDTSEPERNVSPRALAR